MGRTIEIHPVTRIEGHAKIVLDVGDGGDVESGHLQVLEIRGFEKLLQGTELFKLPQVTARLCGVCPAAHHLAAVAAIENGLGVEAPRDAQLLREILYAGHVIHSHALSSFVLSGPDIILGIDAPAEDRNVFSLLRTNADLSKKVLRVRSIGQKVVELVGGRGVHPVTAVPGGMASRPNAEKLELIAGWGWESVQLLEEIGAAIGERLQLLGELHAATQLPYHSLALTRDGTHSMIDGEWVVHDPEGNEERRFDGADYGDHLVEHVMPGSYMKCVHLRSVEEKHFFVGPLARLNINHTVSTPKASAALEAFRSEGVPRLAAVDQIPARLLEMLYFAERMTQICESELGDGPIRVDVAPRGGRFVAAIEAPRGILVHDFTADDQGRVTDVNFIVATQNNYDAMDRTITGLARHYLPANDDNLLLNGVEFALRCFDPCLACATHAAGRMPLEVEIRNRGEVVRRVSRGAAR